MSDDAGRDGRPLKDARIFVAGHQGMVGSALVRRLEAEGCRNLLLRRRSELDLTSQAQVEAFFAAERPEYVFLAAARVGGINANNTWPADFIYDNLAIAAHTIHAAHGSACRRLLFLGSSCIYPRLAPQPMPESALLTGPLEPTNEPYAIAKIAGIKLCESYNRQHGTDFRSVMPTNLYGPNDNFDLATSHVLPAMIRKFHEARAAGAKEVEIWGSGTPRREFLHVDDLAEACLFVMSLPKERYAAATGPMLSHLNVGTGSDVSILELAAAVRDVTGFRGGIRLNPDYPDGAPRKLLDVSRLAGLGWRARIALPEGLASTYDWYRRSLAREG
ncbi:MAG: GDP-L-fucose synthase [Gammaproteobacteria bacterium]|nr:GDP-L-fucose synthase [Gammaproteobacteria bacterium]